MCPYDWLIMSKTSISLPSSILALLLFLTCIKDLPNNLPSNPNLFADDSSLFAIVRDLNSSANYLNDDISKIRDWDFFGKCTLFLIPQNRLCKTNVWAKHISKVRLHYISITLLLKRYLYESILTKLDFQR